MQFCEVSTLYFHWDSFPIGIPAHICVFFPGHLLANTMCSYQVSLVAFTSAKTSVILQAMLPQYVAVFQRPRDPQSGLHSLALVQSMSQHRQLPAASAALHSKAMVKLTMPATSLVFGEPPQTYTPMSALFGSYKLSASFLDQGADFAKCTCLRDLGSFARMWINVAYLDSVSLKCMRQVLRPQADFRENACIHRERICLLLSSQMLPHTLSNSCFETTLLTTECAEELALTRITHMHNPQTGQSLVIFFCRLPLQNPIDILSFPAVGTWEVSWLSFQQIKWAALCSLVHQGENFPHAFLRFWPTASDSVWVVLQRNRHSIS